MQEWYCLLYGAASSWPNVQSFMHQDKESVFDALIYTEVNLIIIVKPFTFYVTIPNCSSSSDGYPKPGV